MMENMNIDKQEIINALEESGVYLYEGYGDDTPLDMDSITFMSSVVALEEKFGVEISDAFFDHVPQTFAEYMEFAVNAITNSK